MGNLLTDTLPPTLDQTLMDMAQILGGIDYNDIMSFGRKWHELPSETQTQTTLLGHSVKDTCFALGLDLYEACEQDPELKEICNKLTAIVCDTIGKERTP